MPRILGAADTRVRAAGSVTFPYAYARTRQALAPDAKIQERTGLLT